MDEWHPHPKQEAALERPEFEILYGGSRGGGKTDAGIVWLTDYLANPRFRGLVIRRNADDLSDWIDRARRFYSLLGAEFAYRPTEIKFPNGAYIKTGHLKDAEAYTKYQGHEYQKVLVEELTQIPDEKRYLQLISSCRSTVPDLTPQVFATTNPGGVGHVWVKSRFVDPAPPGTVFKDPISTRTRIFIPATVDDNPTLLRSDPDYVHELDALEAVDPELYKAWRLGSWDTFAGQYFKEFNRAIHVMEKPFLPRSEFTKYGGLDWGRTAPFSFHATVLIPEEYEGVKFTRAVTYAEVYGTDKTPKEWAKIIADRVPLEQFRAIMADNQIFTPNNDNSMSIDKQFVQANDKFHILRPATKDRIGGWENMHNWLSIAPDGLPYWLITPNCVNLVRTLPQLIHDENRVEDIDGSGEDHAADDQRYMFSAIRWVDARLGGVKHRNNLPQIRKRRGPLMQLDLDKFAKESKKVKNWQEI